MQNTAVAIAATRRASTRPNHRSEGKVAQLNAPSSTKKYVPICEALKPSCPPSCAATAGATSSNNGVMAANTTSDSSVDVANSRGAAVGVAGTAAVANEEVEEVFMGLRGNGCGCNEGEYGAYTRRLRVDAVETEAPRRRLANSKRVIHAEHRAELRGAVERRGVVFIDRLRAFTAVARVAEIHIRHRAL